MAKTRPKNMSDDCGDSKLTAGLNYDHVAAFWDLMKHIWNNVEQWIKKKQKGKF